MITMSRRSLLRNAVVASAGLTIAPGVLNWRAAAASGYPLLPFADFYTTNISANLSFDTNAAVEILSGFSSLWQTGTAWNNGVVLDSEALRANMLHSVWATRTRTEPQAKESYIVDRQNHDYWTAVALGPLAPYYYTGAQATTSITSAPDDIPDPEVSDTGNDGGSTSSALGTVVTLVDTVRGSFSSSNPSKFAFEYPRPWRMNDDSQVIDTGKVDEYGYPVYDSDVIVTPQLLTARSTTPATDGAFPSGHMNAFVLAALAYAYAIPERFQELVTRAMEGGNYRIIAGMHSSVDVIGGRILATALAAAILSDPANSSLKAAARAQALSYFTSVTGASDLFAFAHSAGLAADPYASRSLNERLIQPFWTYVLPRRGPSHLPMVVPQGAEVLLETRLPYLSAAARREVLRTTALPSGYPMLDRPEMWGRLNLFAAADGYGAFDSSVVVTMDASAGSFHAADSWKNDIAGAGGLVKEGSGALTLSGSNTFSGGTLIAGGTVVAASPRALGSGPLSVRAGGTLAVSAGSGLSVDGPVSLDPASSLTLTLSPPVRPGTVVRALSASRVHGTFGTVSAAGHNVVASYDRGGVVVSVTS